MYLNRHEQQHDASALQRMAAEAELNATMQDLDAALTEHLKEASDAKDFYRANQHASTRNEIDSAVQQPPASLVFLHGRAPHPFLTCCLSQSPQLKPRRLF